MHFAKPALIFTAFCVVACTSGEAQKPAQPVQPDFQSVVTASCREADRFVLPEKISIKAESIGWGDQAKTALAPFKPVSVFDLTSADARFGGLSGLDFLNNDTLLMVADDGSFLWLDLKDGQPTDTAYTSLLRDAEGQPLQGKESADSEGIAWNGTYAFVSFEREHRILGYDIEGCGANARGIEVTSFVEHGFGSDRSVKANSGMEALTDFGDGLLAGLEAKFNGGAVYAHIASQKDIVFDQTLPAPELTQLVGLEALENEDGSGRLYALMRSYDPIRGNRNAIVFAEFSSEGVIAPATVLTIFGREVTIDNFEGIAAQPAEEGRDRIYLISDNNFSPRQRTLLGVLEYDWK